MARKLAMSWVPATRRWTKWYRAKTYSVSCQQLGTPETKEASWRQANDWWQQKQQQMDAANPPKKQQHPHQAHLNTIAEKVDWASVHAPQEAPELQEVFTEASKTSAEIDPPEDDTKIVSQTLIEFERLTGVEFPDDVDFEILQRFFGRQQLWADRLERQPVTQVDATNTLRHHADQYLKIKQQKKPGTYGQIKIKVDYFLNCGMVAPTAPASIVSENLWRSYYLHLDHKRQRDEYSAATCHDKLSGARAFINYLYQQSAIKELPRNLGSADLKFRITTKEIKLPPVDVVKDMLRAAGDSKIGLYLHLMLNTGMQQVDIAELTPFQVDWDAGTITRKRTKTTDTKSVPTVCYKLWDTTMKLLEKPTR